MASRLSPTVWVRLLVLAGVIAYLSSPTLQFWLPVWLPVLIAAATELQFFITGYSSRPRPLTKDQRAPQARDIAELGYSNRPQVIQLGSDSLLVLHLADDMAPGEEVDWVEANYPELLALGPGRHELGPLSPGSAVQFWEPPPLWKEEAALLLPQRSVRRRLTEAGALIALVAGLVLLFTHHSGWSTLSRLQQQRAVASFSAAAATIAGHAAHVICDTSGRKVGFVQDADGLAEVGGARIWLTPSICYRLEQIEQTHRAAGSQDALAIAVLAHESWHLHGVADEGLANCYAYQSGVGLGERFGLSDGTAAQLMRSALADNAVFADSAPAYVVPSGCSNGGRYDLHPADNRFP